MSFKDISDIESALSRINLLLLDVKCRQMAFQQVMITKTYENRPELADELQAAIMERWKELLPRYADEMHYDKYDS